VTGKALTTASWDLQLQGDLGLHGVTRRLTVPVRVEVIGDTLKAVGSAVLRQNEFGIKPVSVAGVVKVKNELRVDFSIVAPLAR
jgi:polyisoprenoid-binding protein YceI